MAKKAAIAESMQDDVALTPEEEATLKAQEAGEEAPAPEPAPAAEPEPKLPELPEAGPKGKPKEKYVAIERMDQLNERLKTTEQQLAEARQYQERWARLEERQRMAQEAAANAAALAEAERQRKQRPDPELDPGGARAWDAEQRAIRAEQGLMQMQQQFQQLAQANQTQNANMEMQSWLSFQVPQARMRFQDYDTRVDSARAARAAWWSSVFDLPDGRQIQLFSPEAAREITAREELVLLQRAKDLGIPVADAVVRLSDTWGYPQWLAAQQAAAQQQQQSNGQVRRAAQPQVLPSGNERLDQIQRGQAVQGLGRIQSGEQNANLAWQQLSNAEFKAFVGNMPEDQYLSMVQDPRTGKLFEKRVGEIDLTDLNAA